MVAQYCGLSWEADFWKVLKAAISTQKSLFVPKEDNAKMNVGSSEGINVSNFLDLKFDLACENNSYVKYQKEKLSLHESKCRYDNNLRRNEPNHDLDTMV